MSYSLFSVVDFGAGHAGLSTVGYQIYDPITGFTARSTAGVTQLAPGQYGAQITYADGFMGAEIWDSGEGIPVYALNVINPEGAVTGSTYNVFSVADFGSAHSGLTTVGYKIYDQASNTYGPRITAGVAEIFDGKYGATINYPTGFRGAEIWDSGEVSPVYVTNAVNPRSTTGNLDTSIPEPIERYRAVNYRDEIVHGSAALLGINITEGDLSPDQARNIAMRVNSWVRKGWEYWPWAELLITEERAFRQIRYDALDYPAGTEVYDIDTATYYRALVDVDPGDPVANTASWEVITPLDRFIAFNQLGKQAIGQVIAVNNSNPHLSRNARGILFQRSNHGVSFASGGPTVWVTFRPQQPVFTSAQYDVAKAYLANDLVFDPGTGDCFRALIDSTGAAISDPAAWYRQRFPYLLSEYVEYGVAGDLSEDVQTRASFQAEAEERLVREINKEAEQGIANYYSLADQRALDGRWSWGLILNTDLEVVP